jgi:hypothetical protein
MNLHHHMQALEESPDDQSCEKGKAMDVSPYQVQHVLKVYVNRLKSQELDTSKRLSSSPVAQDEVKLLGEGKKKQLVAQVLSQLVDRLATRRRGQEEVKAAEDGSYAVSPDEGRR